MLFIDRLKLDLHLDNLNTNKQKRKQRNEIIASEIYKMFATIRDHQCASVKARGEMSLATRRCCRAMLRKSGSWSYSTAKRHVIAKVMEMPFADDVSQLARRVGLIYSNDSAANGNQMLTEEQQFNQMLAITNPVAATEAAATNERVFVRIDDYISKQVKHKNK